MNIDQIQMNISKAAVRGDKNDRNTKWENTMSGIKIVRALVGFFIFFALYIPGFAQSVATKERTQICERGELKSQASSRVSIDTINRVEQIEALRARLLEIQMKKVELQDRLDELDYELQPDSIQRALAFVGSVRPMDELRSALRLKLENERARVNELLDLLDLRGQQLEAAISGAEKEAE